MDEVGFPQGQLPVSLARGIIDHTAVPFVLIEPDGTVVFASASLPVVVGWSPEQVVGRNMIDFVDPDEIDLPLAALAEVNTIDRMGSSVPIALRIRAPDGWRHVEIAAMPLFDGEDGDFIALRLRSWEGERHMSDFVRAMLRGGSIEVDIEALSKSLTAPLEGVGAAVHHGFDGTSFVGVAGSWPGARDLPLDGSLWIDALDSEDVLAVPAPERLRNSLRDGDELARLGGDEFTILWRRIPDVEAAETAAARVVEAGDATFGVQRREVSVGVSVGVALARPGSTADGLLAVADAALYEAKEAGGRRAIVRIGVPPSRA